ncbi:MAG: efflux RND transporter permease subunit [Proteobacteria bacterium]|nr:efflux RND transporter permease subunit [Pseudomonadota bacterium]
MEFLIRFFVRRHMLVHVLVLAVVVSGVLAASRAKLEGFPSTSMPIIMIRAQLPGASARDIETKIAIPLEEAIDTVDGITEYTTVINDNLSVTRVELVDDFDDAEIREAEQDLRSAIDAITDFPPEMTDEPTIQRLDPSKLPVLEIALSGPTDAVATAAKRLERRLKREPTVAAVHLVGLRDPEVRILVDPVRAREHAITLLDVVDAVRARNVSATGGMLETERERRQVVLWSRFDQPDQVAETVLRLGPDGSALSLTDVARVEVGREDTGLLAHTNGRPGVSVVIEKQRTADILETVDAIHAVLAQTPLPEGVQATPINDESFEARNRLEIIFTNGLIGAVLVTGIVFVFLTPLTALWVIVGVPVVFLGAITLMPSFGLTINLVETAGFVIVLGMLVDDAVVVSERVLAFREQGLSPAEAAVRGSAAVARPVAAAAITTILAFGPLLALGGMPGRVAWNVPAVAILCLSLSLVESFLILPSHMSLVRTAAPPPRRAFVTRLEEHFRGWLAAALRHRAVLIAGFAAFFVFAVGVIGPRLGVVLIPQDDADGLHLKVSTPVGTPIERTEGIVAALENQLPALLGDDLLAVTARIGHQDLNGRTREYGAAENEALISLALKPVGRTRTADQWADYLKTTLRLPKEAEVVYQREDLGPPMGRPVQVHVSANDDEARRAVAAAIAGFLAREPGVVDVEVDERQGVRQIELDLDYDSLALRGLSAEDVGRTLTAAFYGLEATEHRDLDETTSLRVLFEPSARRGLDSLLETPVRNARGELVRIRDVVRPVEVPAVSRIFHRNGLRTATITAAFAPTSDHTPQSFATFLEAELVPQFADRPELDVVIAGEVVETRKAARDIGLAALLSVAGIWCIIALLLGSFLESFFVVAVIPFGFAAVLVTFFLHGMDLSLLAMIGTVGLSGVVVNTSIVMVDSIQHRLAELENPDAETRTAVVIDAVTGRLRPILVTTLSTLVGVAPTAYGLGGYDFVLSPMSLAVGWGLALATAVTLFLVPALFTLAQDLREKVRRPARPPLDTQI